MENTIDFTMGTAQFHIHMEASATKTTYKGVFKVKCVPSPLEYVNADALFRKLLGDTNPQYASQYVRQLCLAMSQLKYRIIEAPTWFKNEVTHIDGSDVDDKILLYVYEKAIECEQQYRDEMDKRYKEARNKVRAAVDSGELKDNQPKEEEKEEIND